MANHVNTNVEFRRISAEGVAKFNEIMSRVRKAEDGRNYEWFGDMWVDGKDGSPTYEETEQYVWTTENVGPKWCYFDEVGDDYFRLTSAWGYPEDGLTWLAEQIGQVDPNLVMTVTFEDEMPNFYGVSVFTSDGLYDSVSIEYEEMKDDMHNSSPELLALYNSEDEDDQSDEYYEMWNELLWEHISDNQWDTISNIVDSIISEEE